MGPARHLSERDEKDRAHALMLKGKFDDAIGIYRSLLKRNERDPGLWLQLAEAFRKRGLLDDAVNAFRRAATVLAEQGHVARARAALTAALRFAPGEPLLLEALRELRPPVVSRHLTLVPPPATPAQAMPKLELPGAPAAPSYPTDAARAARAASTGFTSSKGPVASPSVTPAAAVGATSGHLASSSSLAAPVKPVAASANSGRIAPSAAAPARDAGVTADRIASSSSTSTSARPVASSNAASAPARPASAGTTSGRPASSNSASAPARPTAAGATAAHLASSSSTSTSARSVGPGVTSGRPASSSSTSTSARSVAPGVPSGRPAASNAAAAPASAGTTAGRPASSNSTSIPARPAVPKTSVAAREGAASEAKVESSRGRATSVAAGARAPAGSRRDSSVEDTGPLPALPATSAPAPRVAPSSAKAARASGVSSKVSERPAPPVPSLLEEDDEVLESGFEEVLEQVFAADSAEEMQTELFCPVFEWLDETPSGAVPPVKVTAAAWEPTQHLGRATVVARPRGLRA